MKDRVGRTPFCARTAFRFRAVLLPALFLTVFVLLCVRLSGAALPLPHPIPPPAEDPPPAVQKPSASTVTTKPASTTTVMTKPASTTTVTTKPATSTTATATPSSSVSATSQSTPIRVNPQPLRDISGNIVRMNGNYGGGTVLLPAAYTPKPNEFRGVWVATAFNLDFAKQATTAEFQASFRSLVARIADMGFNTIMFQRVTNKN